MIVTIIFRYVNVFTYASMTAGVQLDGALLGSDGWDVIPGSNPTVVYRSLLTSADKMTISHIDPNGKVYASAFGYKPNDCAFGYPSAFNMVPYLDVCIIWINPIFCYGVKICVKYLCPSLNI